MTLFKATFLMCLIVTVGGLLQACDTLGPMFGSYKNQLESIVGVTVAGSYTITITKDGRTLATETWQCTTNGQKLTGCHKIASQTVSTDVVAPKVP